MLVQSGLRSKSTSHLVAEIENNVSDIVYLNFVILDDDQVTRIINALLVHKNVIVCFINSVGMYKWCLDHVLLVLQNKTIKGLVLANVYIGNEGVGRLANALKDNHTITLLNLFMNDITDLTDLIAVVKSNNCVEKLIIDYNKITNANAIQIAGLLRSPNVIKMISLTYTDFDSDGKSTILSSLAVNRSIRSVDLTPIDNLTTDIINVIKANNTIEHMDFGVVATDNNINDISTIITGLEGNTSIVSFGTIGNLDKYTTDKNKLDKILNRNQLLNPLSKYVR